MPYFMWYITIIVLDAIDYIGNTLINLTNNSDVLFKINPVSVELTKYISNESVFMLKWNMFVDVFKEISFFIYFQITINLLIIYSFFYNFWIDTLFTDTSVKWRKISNTNAFPRFKKSMKFFF